MLHVSGDDVWKGDLLVTPGMGENHIVRDVADKFVEFERRGMQKPHRKVAGRPRAYGLDDVENRG